MNQLQKQNVNQAVEQWTNSTHQAFRTLADRTVSLQESNLRLTQNFFQNWIEQVNNQAQGTREAAQYMRDQGQRQREAVETLSQEATNAYTESLNSALGFYQQTLSTATQVGQQNIQQAAQATQQGMQAGVQAVSRAGQQAMEATSQATRQGAQATSQAAQQGAQAANQAAQQGARGGEQIARSGAYAAQRVATGVPIRDYDDLNVGEIVEQLDNLSADELHHVRAYEQENKSRDGVLQQIDRKTMEAIGVPIKDYNSLNVGELVGRLDNLSAEELQAARAYEQENKNRDGVLQQIDRRLNAAS
jgi:vacuolar-type H+-ATPase subunit H